MEPHHINSHMDEQLIQPLMNIGLPSGEAAVSLSLLYLGTSTVGLLSDKSGVSASKSCQSPERLVAKGLTPLSHKRGNEAQRFPLRCL